MGIVKEEYVNEYESRVEELCGAFLTAYCDCFYLTGIEERRKCYLKDQPMSIFYRHASEFFYSIVYALQRDAIVIICALEDSDSKTNSVPQLKGSLHNYINDFASVKSQLKKLPKHKLQHVEDCRNKAIAHIELNKELGKVPMVEVKRRLDQLRECYNACLFGYMIKYAISDNKLKDIEEDCCLGVNQLFSGKMDKYFLNRTKTNET